MSLRQKKIMLDYEAAGCPSLPRAALTARGVVETVDPKNLARAMGATEDKLTTQCMKSLTLLLL